MQPPVAGALILSSDQLSPSERLILERAFGHDGKSDVPTDLGDRLSRDIPPEQLREMARRELEAAAMAMPPQSIAKPTGLDESSIQMVKVSNAELDAAFKGNPDNLAASMKIAQAKAATTPRATHIPAPEAIVKPTIPDVPFNPQLARPAAPPQQPPSEAPAAPQPATTAQQPYNPLLRSFEQARQEGVNAINQQEEMSGMHPAVAQAYQQTMAAAPTSQSPTTTQQQSRPTPPEEKSAKEESDSVIADLSKKKLSEMTKEEIAEFRKQVNKSIREAVDPDDYKRYINAVITGQLYTKSYLMLDGRLSVTFAELHSKDSEAIGKQMRYHRLTERVTNDIEQDTELIRLSVTAGMRVVQHLDENDQWQTSYSLPIQQAVSDALTEEQRVAYLAGSDPQPGDTNLYALSQAVHRQFSTSSIRQLIYRAFERFNTHMQHLHMLGQNIESF